MIISHKNKFVIINPPKTGSGFREEVFYEHSDISIKTHEINRHANLRQTHLYLSKSGKRPLDYFSCCFVRNPWKRFASWWNMNVNQMMDSGSIKNPGQALNSGQFSEFIKKIKRSQYDFLTSGNYIVDFIGSLENMRGDLSYIGKKLKLDLNIHENVEKIQNYHSVISELWTQECVDLIAEREKEVIILKNYDFNP